MSFLDVFLELGDVALGRFGDAAAIELPSFVAVEDLNDVALGKIFLPLLIGRHARKSINFSKPVSSPEWPNWLRRPVQVTSCTFR